MIAFLTRLSLGRKVSATLCATALAAGGLAAIPAPASATVTTLCTGYTGCAKAGMGDAGYSKVSGKMYWRMYAGHNCTNYAAYRMIKAGLPNTRPWSGGGNATYWGTSMKSITNATPRVGSIAWWKAGVSPAGSSGHVAYVERVVSATEIIVSMDSWHGDFSWARVTKATKGWPSGFVHFKDVQILNSAAPKITGTAKVGSSLTASAGSWTVTGATYAYQWLADGATLSGATSSTLALTNALKGKKISVRVTASKLGHASTAAVSSATAAVQPGVLSNPDQPGVSGEPEVGSTLTASPGSWSPGPVTTSYRWLADGQVVAGATGATLPVGVDLLGKAISVEVTATRTGYAAVKAVSPATDPIAPGRLPATTPPPVVGQALAGKTLRLGALPAVSGATTEVRWSRNYARIPGATTRNYRVSYADLGHRVRAVVIVKRAGYRPLVLKTDFSRIVRTKPGMRLVTRVSGHQVAFRATVKAYGIKQYNGVLKVRSGGKVIRTIRVVNGVAAGTLTRQPTGRHSYRFKLPLALKTQAHVVKRTITIR